MALAGRAGRAGAAAVHAIRCIGPQREKPRTVLLPAGEVLILVRLLRLQLVPARGGAGGGAAASARLAAAAGQPPRMRTSGMAAAGPVALLPTKRTCIF